MAAAEESSEREEMEWIRVCVVAECIAQERLLVVKNRDILWIWDFQKSLNVEVGDNLNFS